MLSWWETLTIRNTQQTTAYRDYERFPVARAKEFPAWWAEAHELRDMQSAGYLQWSLQADKWKRNQS